jgi:hypothetical protein
MPFHLEIRRFTLVFVGCNALLFLPLGGQQKTLTPEQKAYQQYDATRQSLKEQGK